MSREASKALVMSLILNSVRKEFLDVGIECVSGVGAINGIIELLQHLEYQFPKFVACGKFDIRGLDEWSEEIEWHGKIVRLNQSLMGGLRDWRLMHGRMASNLNFEPFVQIAKWLDWTVA